MNKVVFFDIDGTLTDWSHNIMEMTDRVKTQIRALKQNGDYTFISTGRPYAFIDKRLLEFGFDGFILSNGGQILLNEKEIFSEAMDKKFVKEACDYFRKVGGQYVLEGPHKSYLDKGSNDYYNFFEEIGIDMNNFVRNYKIEDLDIYKMEVLCDSKECAKKCAEFIEANPKYGYFQSIDSRFLETYIAKNTKGSAITKVVEYLGLNIEDSYAFGDGINDIEMIETVGCGIAMGNALDIVKEIADVITDTVNNDGVAAGIEKYILQK